MWDHFVLYCTVYITSTYVGPLCIASVPMWDHFALHCLPHQYLCGTTLYCISTYVGPLCIALFTSPVPTWTTLYCISTYVGPLCIALFTSSVSYVGPPVPMWDHHFVGPLHCLPHQYLCGTTLYVGPLCVALFTSPVPTWTTLYCISTYVGPLCIALFTSSVPMGPPLHQYLCGTTLYCTVYASSVGLHICGTTLYCTVYITSTYVGPLCIASVPMWDHFALHCLPHQYLCGTTLYCISTYVGPLCIALFTSPVPTWTTLYCISTYVGPLCIAL